MPMQVPQYDTLRVGYQTPRVSELKPVFADDVQKDIFSGFAKVQAGFAEEFQKLQDEADKLQVNKAANELKQWTNTATFSENEGYTNLKGWNALLRGEGVDLVEEYSEKFNTTRDNITKNLGNQRQRDMFAAVADHQFLGFRSGIEEHKAKQFIAAQKDTNNDQIDTAEISALNNIHDPNQVLESKNVIRKAIYQNGRIDGDSPDGIKNTTLTAMSNLNSKITLRFLDMNDIEGAKNYFKENTHEFTAPERDRLQKLIDGQALDQLAYDESEVFINEGIRKKNEATTYEEINANQFETARLLAKEKYANDAKTLKAVNDEINRKEKQFESDRQEKFNLALQDAYQWINDTGTFPPASILNAMRPEDVYRLKTMFNKQGTKEEWSKKEPSLKFLAELENSFNKDAVGTANNIINKQLYYQENLGKDFEKYKERALKIVSEKDVGDVEDKVIYNTVKEMMQQSGVNFSAQNKNAELILGAIVAGMSDAVHIAQTGAGGKLKGKDLENFIREQLARNYQTIETGLFGGVSRDDYPVLQRARNPNLIPPQVRDAIIQSYKAQGIKAPNEFQVMSRFVQFASLKLTVDQLNQLATQGKLAPNRQANPVILENLEPNQFTEPQHIYGNELLNDIEIAAQEKRKAKEAADEAKRIAALRKEEEQQRRKELNEHPEWFPE